MKKVIISILFLCMGPVVMCNPADVSLLILRTVNSHVIINPALLALRSGRPLYLPFEYLTEDLRLDFSYRPQTLTVQPRESAVDIL